MTNSGSGWSETFSYSYDNRGNIETVSEGNTQKAKYYYDSLNQLVREDNAWLNKTIAYSYDLGGNLLEVSEYALTSAASLSGLTPTQVNSCSYNPDGIRTSKTAGNRTTHFQT